MLLGYNVSHMGQHFSIKQSEMKRSGALVFARRLLSFQRLSLTSSTSFSGISALEFFWGFFRLCAFGGETRTILQIK